MNSTSQGSVPRVPRPASLALLLLLTATGCGLRTPATASHDGDPDFISTRLVLGSADVLQGIPGEGPLSIEAIDRWLSQKGIHEPLDVVLPIAFADAAGAVSIPPDNPLTRSKIELGRQLFFDQRLSAFGTMACATCHMPEQDYSVHGTMPDSRLNPPVCFNRIFSKRQSWDGRDASLEEQAAGPITNPLEMGTTPQELASRLESIEGYRRQFVATFGKVDLEAVGAALASFQRALVTGPSPWDYQRLLAKYEGRSEESISATERELVALLRAGAQSHPMSDAAIRGEALFFSERTKCGSCHSGPNLTDEAFHNVGVGMDDEPPHLGRFKATQREEDRGAFKTPTLRNVARTSPYMHNGQFGDLRKVVDWFDRGGLQQPQLDRAIVPLNLTRDEKRDLIAFLESLTGELPTVQDARLPE